MVQHFHTQIEIHSSPEEVRKIFLNFSDMPNWHTESSFTPLSPEKPVIEPGDRIKLVSDGTTLTPVVKQNTLSTFQWRGSFYGLLFGLHTFRFEPSQTTPGSTTFVQDEDFSGLLATVLFYEGSNMRKKTMASFQIFNEDLKRRVENGKGSESILPEARS